jgi:hypothetical protein
MKRIMPVLTLAVLVALHAHATPLPAFSLVPSGGTISSLSGVVVGWGYDITSTDSADWVVLDDSYVTGSLASGTFGSYTDYIASNFIVIDPSSSTGSVHFNAGMTGTGEFDIKAAVPPNTIIPGEIAVDYSVFSQNPNSPSFDPGSFVISGTVFAAATVDVNVSGAPEPRSLLLIVVGSLTLGLAVRVTGRMRSQRAVHTAGAVGDEDGFDS